MRTTLATLVTLTIVLMSLGAAAQTQKLGRAGNDPSSANDPSAPLPQIQLQNW